MLIFLFSISDESDHFKIEYIYNTFHSDMVRLAKSKLKKAGMPNYDLDAEDAVQNAFIKITKYIKKININANNNELKAYLLTIVSNEVYNLKSEYTYYDDVDEYAEKIEDNEFISSININERYEKVVTIVKEMDDKYSMTLLYRVCDNMSVEEIAKFMGIPEKTVYTRLERGKRKILEQLEEESR